MICDTNKEFGMRIAEIRKKQHITQADLAYLLTELSGRQVSVTMVSAWERGAYDIPAAMMIYLCDALHCSSYQIYPHSKVVSDREIQLMEDIKQLSGRKKEILHYLVRRWKGDSDAFAETILAIAVMPKYKRYYSYRAIVDEYKQCIRNDIEEMDRSIEVDLPLILQAIRDLEKEIDEE